MSWFILSRIPNDLFGASYYIVNRYAALFLFGIRNTLIIALTGTLIGLLIGLGIGLIKNLPTNAKDSSLKIWTTRLLKLISSLYVEIFRGTPMMVQAVFIYYTFLNIFRDSKLLAGVVIVSINTGAYMAEIIRSGIQSLDKGQNEAARSLGMSNFQSMTYIVLPQAIKNAFPAIGNEFVVNIKDTSVLNVIGITELYFQSNTVAGVTYRFTDTFFITALIYLVLTYGTTLLLRKIEQKMNMKPSFSSSSSSTPILIKHYEKDEI